MHRISLWLAVAASVVAYPGLGLAQKAQGPDLRKPAGKEWLTIGGDWYNTRYSTLTQINRNNVKNLKGAWVTHLGSGLGSKYSFEGTPIVKDGILYIATGNDDVFALDGRTGALIWEHRSHIEQNISTVCCGWDNRGVAVGDGKVFIGQLDGVFVAIDMKTGAEVWRTQLARWQDGYTITAAPLYHNGMVYSGISGGDRQARGFLAAIDAKTGKEKWRFWTVPAPGEFGSDTWPKPDDPDAKRANAWKEGGAAIWQTPAVDPELGLIFFSTGQPGPTAIGVGINRPGDNLFSSSIVAVTLEGKYAWHFQQVHHDLWDFDCPSPVILFEQVYDGKMRKGIAEACKTGWIYILDRTTGKPLIGIDEKPVEQEPRNATAATQPIPRGDAVMPQCPQPLSGWQTKCIFGTVWDIPLLMSPGGNGGVNWSPMAYSPRTGYFYATAADRPTSRIAPGSGKQASPAIGAKYGGTLTAVDSRTNKIAWQKRMPYSIGQGSGSLVTATDLLFHGEPDGKVQAYDARNGELLWQWQTGAGADAPAITYEIDGTQYVAIAVGGVSIQTTSTNGDTVWAFSLKGSPGDRLRPFEPPAPPPSVVGFVGAVERTNTVRMQDYAFSPGRITVTAGTKVTFTNGGSTQHNAASADAGGWDTGLLNAGQTATVTFNRPGTYNYICTPHLFMIGQIIVTGEALASAPATLVESPAPIPASAPAPGGALTIAYQPRRSTPMIQHLRAPLAIAMALIATSATAADRIRLAVQRTGTLSWELDIIRAHGLDKKADLDIQALELATPEAGKVAVRGGSADMFLSDWLYVSRERALGDAMQFYPSTSTLGGVMVPANSPIRDVADLKGKKLAVAGGPIDKSWLLLQGLAKRVNVDLRRQATIVFGAPPLLTQKALQGENDATLTYWNFCADLESKGFKEVISTGEVMQKLGAKAPVAILGYTFDGAWAAKNKSTVDRFIDAARQAKDILASSEAEWQRLAPRIGVSDPKALALYRQRYRDGIVTRTVAEEEADARALYGVLAEIGGTELVGPARELDRGTFYRAGAGL